MNLPPIKPAELPSVARVKARQRRALVPTEHEIQVALVSACRMLENLHPDLGLLFAVPNGGYRSKKTAALLRQEGCRPGVPDLILPVARRGYIGMAIELKRPDTGRLSEAQAAYLAKLQAAGWYVRIHTDCGDALADVLLYLNG